MANRNLVQRSHLLHVFCHRYVRRRHDRVRQLSTARQALPRIQPLPFASPESASREFIRALHTGRFPRRRNFFVRAWATVLALHCHRHSTSQRLESRAREQIKHSPLAKWVQWRNSFWWSASLLTWWRANLSALMRRCDILMLSMILVRRTRTVLLLGLLLIYHSYSSCKYSIYECVSVLNHWIAQLWHCN